MKSVYLAQTNYLHGPESNNMYFPYSVGCIWSYAVKDKHISENYKLKEFIVLRESIEDVINRLDNPKFFGFSCYMWNEKYHLALSEAVKDKFPDCLIIFGGPQVPDDPREYLKENPQIDICIRGEGEEPFKQMLLGKDLKDIKGVFTKDFVSETADRIDNLDDIPSPYTSGVFDELLLKYKDINWNVLIETDRGCPFRCTFCDWGSLTYQKVKKYSVQKIKEEIDWLTKNNFEYMNIVDANFGIFKERALEIVDYLIDVRKRTGYPKQFATTYTKNSSEFVLDMATKLYKEDLMRSFNLSVQSMDDAVLEAIQRRNMQINNLEHYFTECQKRDLPFYTELIMMLPNETYHSWTSNIIKLLELGQHSQLEMHFLQILRNSPLNKENRKMKTVQARIDLGFNYTDGFYLKDDYPEVVNIVVETETMSFDDFINCIMFNWMIVNFHSYGWTQLISRYLVKSNTVSFDDFYRNLIKYIQETKFIKKEYDKIKQLANNSFSYDNLVGLEFPTARLIYSSQINFHTEYKKVWDELKIFFDRYEVSEDLFRFQQDYIRRPDESYPVEKTFNYDWYKCIFKGDELKNGGVKIKFDIRDNFKSMFEYKEKLFFLKRQSWGNTIIS
jgi:putative methyltransferase